MKLPKLLKRRGQKGNSVVIEDVNDDWEIPTCTFDEDADPSIERCWEDELPLVGAENVSSSTGALYLSLGGNSFHPLTAAAGLSLLAAVLTLLYREIKVRSQKTGRSEPKQAAVSATESTTASNAEVPFDVTQKPSTKGHAKVRLQEQPAGGSNAISNVPRIKELKQCLEKETKEKQGLTEQNNFLRSALEDRKTTVEMFTTELQSRDEQLANFEQEQVKVKNELYTQIETLKNELQVQEKLQQENLNNMDGQCADLAGKVEGLMKELANREEQWEAFEKDAKTKEADSAAQIEAIKKDFATKEKAQMESLNHKSQECSELSNKIEALTSEMSKGEVQLSKFRTQREKWSEATVEMKRVLKEKREEIVGLTSRMELFVGELNSREQRVNGLEQKLEARKELSAEQLESLRSDLEEQKAEQEEWDAKTTELNRLLGEREAESKELTTKLESLTKELRSTVEKVTALEATVAEKEETASLNAESLEKALAAEKEQRSKSNENLVEINRALNERQEECASLTARLEMFNFELQSRETIVTKLEKQVNDREEVVASQLNSLEKQYQAKQEDRDSWSKSTKEIYRLLEEKKEQCVGLQTRVDLFNLELKKREDRVASLESVLKDKEDYRAAQLEPYRSQLKMHQDDLGKWSNNTDEINSLLKDRQNQCVGLNTRLLLFGQQLQQYEDQVETLTEKVEAKMGSYNEELSPLKEQLEKQRAERDSWNEKTIEIGRLFKDRQEQCTGLSTRLGLFQQQTRYHQEQVAILEAKVSDLEERFALQINPLKQELIVHREGLEAWRTSTLNVERLLKQAEKESEELTLELKRHVVALNSCQQEVTDLQKKISVKEDLSVTRREAYLSDHNEQQHERQKWANSTDELETLLKDKEGQVVGLTTRLSLFKSELSNKQNLVSTLECTIKERGETFDSEISSLRNELAFQKEQRDHCLESTLHMNKSMKEVKEPCIGLTTRITLFRKELDAREERVKVLTSQIQEKEETAMSQLNPLRELYHKEVEDRDKWNDATLDIFWMLKDRQDQSVGLSTRLELFMNELHKKEEAVEKSERRLKEAELGRKQVKDMRNEILEQEEQLRKWNKSTDDISRLLKEKEDQRIKSKDKHYLEQECISLSAKLELFRGELQRREDRVKKLRAAAGHKEELMIAEEEAAKKQIPSLKEDRDSWMEKTLDINRRLKSVQAECTGLTTRWELFQIEQKKKKEQVAALESRLQEKEHYFASSINPYKKELQVQTDLRNKWRETTQKMDRLLKRKESECITFSTQLECSIDELSSRKEQIARLEERLSDKLEWSAAELQGLRSQLKRQVEELENWKNCTLNVEQLLREKTQECGNLKVRLQVFRRQIENQDDRIARLESAYKAKQGEAAAQMKDLRTQLQKQEEARDKSVESTLEINKQIRDKELQCTSISVRLNLFRTELKNREGCVAKLESKLEETEGLSASQLDPMKSRLSAEKKELEKWAKSTVDIEELLKVRDEERIGLSTRLKLFQLQLKMVEENVAKLEEKVNEKEEAAATEVAPFTDALQTQQVERERWDKATQEIHDLLQDRKSQITGLTTRLTLFRREVKHREELVESIQMRLDEKEGELNEQHIEPVERELAAHQEQRDQWAETTAGLVKMLKEKRENVAGLSTRLSCFQNELQKREQACNAAKKNFVDNKELSGAQIQVLKRELAMQVTQRDQWRATTSDMNRQLEEKKKECVELSSRVEVAKGEIKCFDQKIDSLLGKISANDAAHAEVQKLKNELKVQQEHRDALNKSTVETDELLKEKKDQCAGLATRLLVFRQELQKRMERLGSTERKIKEKEDISNAQIESLKNDLLTQRQQREKWSETTAELKQLLKEKEAQCSALSAELDILTSLQG